VGIDFLPSSNKIEFTRQVTALPAYL